MGWGHSPELLAEAAAEIARIADTQSRLANVGGRETAGALVSHLALYPEDAGKVLRNGFVDLGPEFLTGGLLSWHAASGEVVYPEDERLRGKPQ